MKCLLMKNKTKILEFHLEIHITDFFVKNIKIFEFEKLPFSIRCAGEYDSNLLSDSLYNWMKMREIPNEYVDLDSLLTNLYKINAYEFGRMFGYQHLASCFSYFLSGFDDYYITPEKKEVIYLGLEDHRFRRLYSWIPYEQFNTYDSENEIMSSEKNSKVEKCNYFERSLTIPSELKSCWRGERLIQILNNTLSFEKAKFIITFEEKSIFFGHKEIGENKLINDFSGMKNYEIMWCKEYQFLLNHSIKNYNFLEINKNMNLIVSMGDYLKKKNIPLYLAETGFCIFDKTIIPFCIL